ncbi:MAG TPA: hypothetical protein VGR89_07460, partial [Puia sp.]|nr:hypothetical protein [Puia sp.]
MRFLSALTLLTLCSLPTEAGTWYVSNTTANGYGTGSDANEGTTTASPFLTIDYAVRRAAAGDEISVNPSGTPYEESSGNVGCLVLDKKVILQTDPSLRDVGKAGIRPVAGAVAPMQIAADGILLQDLVIDANNSSTLIQGLSLQSDVISIALRRCDFVNFPASAGFCMSTSITNGQILLERCSAARENGVSSAVRFLSPPDTAPNVSITLLGCTISGIEGVFLQSGLAPEPFGLTCDQAQDGTRNTFSNLSYCITWGACAPGTAITVKNSDLYHIDSEPFRGLGSPAPFIPALHLESLAAPDAGYNLVSTEVGETIGSLWISDLTHSGSHYVVHNAGTISKTSITNCAFSGSGPVIYSANAQMQDLSIAGCRFLSNSTVINMPQGGQRLTVESCQFTNCTSTSIALSGILPNILVRSNTCIGAYGLLAVDGALASNIVVDANFVSLTQAATDPIAIIGSGAGEVMNNRIWSDAAAAHGIMVGMDGYYRFDANSGATTSNNLGDTASHAWIAQRWNMVDASAYYDRG